MLSWDCKCRQEGCLTWCSGSSTLKSTAAAPLLCSSYVESLCKISLCGVKLLSHVQLSVTPWTNSSVHGILQARILEWVAMPPYREDFNDFSQMKCCLCSKNALTGDIHSLAYSSSAAQSYPTHCDPMDCSMPGLPVYHQLPEPAQIHVHQVGDAT